MKKCFNNVQMFKSSENCDKYSKSVSYETLVGGTATTGRDNRQIRRLFKGSVDKPLTAVGTLTSLLCNSAKVVEKWLQTSHVLRLVKVLSLLAVLSAVIISESRAGVPDGCIGAKYEGCSGSGYSCTSCVEGYELVSNCWYKTCQKGCNSDEERINGSCTRKCAANEERINGSCTRKCTANEVRANGTCTTPRACENGGGYSCLSGLDGTEIANCCYKVDGDTTIIYPEDETQESNVQDAVISSNNNLIVESGIKNLSGLYFSGFDSLYIADDTTLWNNGCDLKMYLSPKKHIIISENGSEDFFNAFKGCSASVSDNYDIVCLGDINKCRTELSNIGRTFADRVVLPTKEQCNGSGTYGWNGDACVKKDSEGKVTCASGFVEWDNKCLDEYPFAKKRWTPAEASKWLHDGNDNFVVITFKK